VPFYLRTGKRLPKKLTDISIVFREPPLCLFQSLESCAVEANVLRIALQPDEAFSLFFDIKVPGEPVQLKQYPLQFRYADAFEPLPNAYQTLIQDIMRGDQTLFVRADEVEAAWQLYTSLLEAKPKPRPYVAGTWGPSEADQLLESDGRQWRTR
jgi:glucose-6-phosphate 1-dehydrogenase